VQEVRATPIDRQAVVGRHDVHVRQVDPESALSVGNGDFAFTIARLFFVSVASDQRWRAGFDDPALAAIAGFVDAHVYVHVTPVFVANMSGNLVHLGVFVGLGSWREAAGSTLALGAFLAGVLASASGRAPKIEHLVLPLRDIFAAIFFVAVGMLLEPRSLAAQAGPILVLTAVVLLGQTLGAALGGALAGLPLRAGFRTGMALAQPGEFSFVLVGIGVHARFLGPDLMAVPVGVCLLTALLGPTLFRRGDALAAELERRIPVRINWYLKIYQTWAARLGRSSLGRGPAPLRRPLIFLLLDAALIDALIIGTSLLKRHLPWFQALNVARSITTAGVSPSVDFRRK